MMTAEELADARLLWKASYAGAVFRRVQAACKHILEHRVETTDPIFYALMVSICVLYGRPFQPLRHVGRLLEDIVPSEYLPLHQALLRHREAMLAHGGADAEPLEESGEASQVRFWVAPDRVQVFAPELRAQPLPLPQVIELANALEDKMEYHTSRLRRKYIDQVPGRPGQYRINIASQDEDFLSEVPPPTSAS